MADADTNNSRNNTINKFILEMQVAAERISQANIFESKVLLATLRSSHTCLYTAATVERL